MDRRKQWKEKNYGRVLDYQNEWYREQRRKAIAFLGGKCVRCGFDDERALQIDHIDGRNGQKREHRGQTCRRVLNGDRTYQLLCANCNWIKRHECGEHGVRPRQPRKECVS